jgi:hypothetical protein
MMCSTLSSINRSGTERCAAHHSIALAIAPISADWQSKINTMMCYTIFRATPGANIVFFQIGKCCTPLLAPCQFFHTLLIICAQVVAKSVFAEGGFFTKIKNNVRCPNTKALAIDKHQFRHTLVFVGQYISLTVFVAGYKDSMLKIELCTQDCILYVVLSGGSVLHV